MNTRFSKKNVIAELERLITARKGWSPDTTNVAPQDVAGVLQIEMGKQTLLETVLDELKVMEGPLSRSRWEERLDQHMSRAGAGRPFEHMNGYAQCRGCDLARWEWYGYFFQAKLLKLK